MKTKLCFNGHILSTFFNSSDSGKNSSIHLDIGIVGIVCLQKSDWLLIFIVSIGHCMKYPTSPRGK